MDRSPFAVSLSVRSSQPVRLQNGCGRRVMVIEGNVWLTQDGDPRDIVLRTGDDFLLDRRTDALVSALGGDARIAYEDGVAVGPRAP